MTIDEFIDYLRADEHRARCVINAVGKLMAAAEVDVTSRDTRHYQALHVQNCLEDARRYMRMVVSV